MKLKNAGRFVLTVVAVLSITSGYSQVPVAPGPNAPAPAVPVLSPGAAEVVRLAGAGTGDDVTLAYIQNAQSAFNLTADHILYLKDVGLSSQVITAMLNRDAILRQQQPGQYTYDQRAYPAVNPPQISQPAPEPEPVIPTQPVPAPVQEAVSPPPVYVSDAPAEVNYFYNDLSPYGTWVDLPGYGWCWQPRTVVVNHDWRPYCDGGHWVNTDAGWCWQSDYSWGWAPFHYGRWHLHERAGWVWFPDTVWAPAWVTWRVSGDNCGWAPLPLHTTFDARSGFRFNNARVGVNFDFGLGAALFTFVALRDFNEHDLGHRRLPPAEVTKIYRNTTIINNYAVKNNTIINRGVPVERVAAVTHQTIKKVAIRDVTAGDRRVNGTGIVARGAAGGVVYRPQLRPPAKTIPMVAQKLDERHPVIQHAAIPTAKVERRSPPGNGVNAPTITPAPRATQTERPNLPRQAPVEKQPAQNNRNSPPPTATTHATAPAAGTAPVVRPIQRQDVAKQPGGFAESPRTETATRYSPQQNNGQRQPNTGQISARQQNPQVYYPKSYHQAEAIHSLPQPRSQNQNKGAQAPSNSTARPENGAGPQPSNNKKD